MENKILNKLISIQNEYDEIQEKLLDPKISSDISLISSLKKKSKSLESKVDLFQKWKLISQDNNDAKEIIKLEKDANLISEFRNQISINKKKILLLEENILSELIEVDPLDKNNAFFEISGAAGGEEGNLFAADLFRMYQKYASKLGWKTEIITYNESDTGGYSYISFRIVGTNVYGTLRFESGVHRVQRVPSTETQGRLHTSTSTVSVFPEVDESNDEIKISNEDIRVDTFRASGAGGQHINKTDSAIRITHIPSGIVVQSQDGRSQHDNRDKAMRMLKSKLILLEEGKKNKEKNDVKKALIGTGDRSAKIRTYNFPQNRVTDHRIGLTIKKLDRIMEGNLDEVVDILVATVKKNLNDED